MFQNREEYCSVMLGSIELWGRTIKRLRNYQLLKILLSNLVTSLEKKWETKWVCTGREDVIAKFRSGNLAVIKGFVCVGPWHWSEDNIKIDFRVKNSEITNWNGSNPTKFQGLIFVQILMKLQSLRSIDILTASNCCIVKEDDKNLFGRGRWRTSASAGNFNHWHFDTQDGQWFTVKICVSGETKNCLQFELHPGL